MSADFRAPLDRLAIGLRAHADQDNLRGIRRAIFLDRGGHAPGEPCPSSPARVVHESGCGVFGALDECDCRASES